MTWRKNLRADGISPIAFRAIVLEIFEEENPEAEVEEVEFEGQSVLSIAVGDQTVLWNLERTYEHVRATAPDARESMLVPIVSDFLMHAGLRDDSDQQPKTERIMPVLRRLDDVAAMPATLTVTERFSDELVVAYVVDHESSMGFLSEEALGEIGVAKSALRELALANLLNRVEGKVESMEGWGMVVAGGAYEPSFALLDVVADDLQAQCKGQLLACFPANDMFVFADSANVEACKNFTSSCTEIFNSADNALSLGFFVRTEREWLPWAGTP